MFRVFCVGFKGLGCWTGLECPFLKNKGPAAKLGWDSGLDIQPCFDSDSLKTCLQKSLEQDSTYSPKWRQAVDL